MKCLAVFFALSLAVSAQTDFNTLKELKYRTIGPFRGGRVDAVAGVASQPNVYYFGATGGGIWKSTDSGAHWDPVADGQLKTGSVGAIAVSESDPNIVYAGMGEPDVRGNASHGDGVYKSTDAGKTWKRMGLEDTYHIGAVRIHPRNPDLVYVAALGHLFGPSDQRGVFRSKDGGKTWEQVLNRGPKAGAVDLALDPGNASVLYAGIWEEKRTPWSFESGGPGGGLFQSTDGGDTWTDITRNEGFPKGVVGRIGVTVSRTNSDRVWAIVEAEDGGVFRSDNAGKTWTRVNQERKLRQRAWYYSRIYADPQRPDTVYVLNTSMYRSDDGGKTFQRIPEPHGDNHCLWIAPNDGERMIESNDGGANVSTNGGRTWTPQNQQPTAQFYRVALDNDFPYHVYGAQQDNTTVRIASRSDDGGPGAPEWYAVGGGESGWIAPDPKNSEIVYAGSYDGLLTRVDHRTHERRDITVWPDNPMGYGAEGMKFRFQWSFPLFFSPHDANTLYAGGNVLFKTIDEGRTWEPISPDLTRNDKTKQKPSGGPITKDNTGVEYYDTIFTAAESTLKKGLIWTGSDDGLIYLTRDAGRHWENVTPKELPEWSQINSVEASPHDPATAYVAATMYKSDDFLPYIYATHDYGKTWALSNYGIPARAFARVVRADPNRRGLLYAGTETGLYVSFDDAATWQSLQLNLPVVPITDLAIHAREKELVVATQGRAFWILDDLPLLYQLADVPATPADMHLFAPKNAYRQAGGGGGVAVYFTFKEKPKDDVMIEILDESGKLIRTFTSKKPEKEEPAAEEEDNEDDPAKPGADRVPAEAGLNRFVWNMRYPDATKFPGMIFWGGSVRGPLVVPGAYKVRLGTGGKSETQTFEIHKDPRLLSTPAEFASQLELSLKLHDKLSAVNQAVVDIRAVKKQLERYTTDAKVGDAAKALNAELTAVEEALYQTKNQSAQDPLNYPIRLNNKLAALANVVASSATAPTRQATMVFEDLASQANALLQKFASLQHGEVAAFNRLVRDRQVPALSVTH